MMDIVPATIRMEKAKTQIGAERIVPANLLHTGEINRQSSDPIKPVTRRAMDMPVLGPFRNLISRYQVIREKVIIPTSTRCR
jgi:hypothetical protein